MQFLALKWLLFESFPHRDGVISRVKGDDKVAICVRELVATIKKKKKK